MPITLFRPPDDAEAVNSVVQALFPSFTFTGLRAGLPLFVDGDRFDDEDDGESIHPEFIVPDVLEGIERRERGELVRVAVADLPQQQRLVVYCLHWLDLRQREIAPLAGVTEGRVSQLVGAAYSTLRRELAHLYN